MDSVATIVGVVAALIIIGIGYMITKASEASEPVEAAVAVNGEGKVAAAQEKKKKKKKGNVGLARMRERHKKGQSTGGGATTALLVDAEADSEDESERQQQLSKKKIGAKKAAKLEAKAERREAQEAMKKIREDEKAREDLRFAEEKKEREKEAEAERDQEEEEARKAEELKQKEEEEYQAMKAMFSVEEAGSVAETIQTESQGLLAEFVDYIKDTKVVLLEDLATRFGLKTQDAIMRLKNLEEMGRITGVMDDRGKYIYISDDEMNAVVKFIKQRGRVTLADLSENSHKLIRLGGELCPALTESG